MINFLWLSFKWIGILFVILGILTILFLTFAPQFGASPKSASLDRIKASPNQQEGKFENLIDTTLDTREPGEGMDLKQYLFPPEGKNPTEPLPSERFNPATFSAGEYVWFGHSTLLFKTTELTILTDPVFNRASPVPVGGKPFAMTETPTADDLPDIDVVIISHDHYDHLDYKAISDIASQVALFLVPLGIQAHLEHWGVPTNKIVERDWYQEHQVDSTAFTLTPTRHFSGRGVTNRNSTLWGAWVIKHQDTSIYYGGDSGYFDEFKKVGEQYGPFDIAFLENGAYDKAWAQIHMMPEESVQAALDLKAELFFPIHWGKYDLAKHRWTDPIERAVAAARQHNLPLVSPKVGQVFTTSEPPFEPWWK